MSSGFIFKGPKKGVNLLWVGRGVRKSGEGHWCHNGSGIDILYGLGGDFLWQKNALNLGFKDKLIFGGD